MNISQLLGLLGPQAGNMLQAAAAGTASPASLNMLASPQGAGDLGQMFAAGGASQAAQFPSSPPQAAPPLPAPREVKDRYVASAQATPLVKTHQDPLSGKPIGGTPGSGTPGDPVLSVGGASRGDDRRDRSASGFVQDAREGFMGGVNNLLGEDFRSTLNDAFLGLSMGGDLNSSIRSAGMMIAQGRLDREERGNTNQTRKLAVEKYGLDPEVAKNTSGRDLATFIMQQQVAARRAATPDWEVREVNGQLGRFNKNDPAARFEPLAGAPTKQGPRPLSAEERTYWGIPAEDKRPYARDADGKPVLIGGSGTTINVDAGPKLPSGFRWTDENDHTKGVEPIPGGPATQMPAELAARVGVTDNFLGQAPAIRKRLEAGELTGAYDRFMGGNVSGSSQAEIGRQIKSGTDALMRFLTGAGMNQTEAEAYASRYEVGYGDTTESALSKFDQLTRELTAARDRATQSRNDPSKPGASPGGAGWQDLGGGVRIRQR